MPRTNRKMHGRQGQRGGGLVGKDTTAGGDRHAGIGGGGRATTCLPRARGSAMLLVVTALVLAMLLGLAYITTAREDRDAGRTQSLRNSIDQVESSVLNEIRDVLREDLGYDPREETYFTHRDERRGPFYAGARHGWARPAIDYAGPFAEQAGPFPETEAEPDGLHFYTPSPWLASTAPLVFDPNRRDNPQPTWMQITRLTDRYVNADGLGPRRQHFWDPVSSEPLGPGVQEVDPDDPLTRSLQTMADATGDGILDSRWERAPLYSLNGIDYYMAVRITDNSALLNANTAFSQLNEFGGYFQGYNESLRWDYPTELDLGSLVHRYQMSGPYQQHGTWMLSDLERFMQWRARGNDTLPILPEQQAADYWSLSYGNLYADDLSQLPIGAELSLRHRSGLNNPRLGSVLESDAHGLYGMLRQYNSGTYDDGQRRQEGYWEDAYANMLDDGVVPPHELSESIEPHPDQAALIDYFQLNPRGHLTTVSGSTPSLTHHGKWDLKTLLDTERMDHLREIVREIYRHDELDLEAIEQSIPAGLREHAEWAAMADDSERIEALAAQYAVNLLAFSQGGLPEHATQPIERIDAAMPRYVREDESGGEEARHYGLVPLPYVAAVYSQRKYVASDIEALEDPATVTWDAVGPAGYVFEIRNPHRRPVRLDTVRVRVDGDDWGLASELTGRERLGAGETVYLMHHSGTTQEPPEEENRSGDGENAPPEAETTEDNVWNLVEHEGGEATWSLLHDEEERYRWPVGEQRPVTIELLSLVRDTNRQFDQTQEQQHPETAWLNDADAQPWYRYQQVEGQTAYAEQRVTADESGTVEEGDEAWHQHAVLGDARGLNIMTIMPDAFAEVAKDLDAEEAHDDDRDRWLIGVMNKTPGGGPLGPIANWEHEQIVFPKQPGIRNVGELALVTVLGPRGGNTEQDWTIANAWQTSGDVDSIDDYQLTMGLDADGALIDATAVHPEAGVPHVFLLMEQFSTHRYVDAEELEPPMTAAFTPGTININTATRETLLAALPVPWDADASEEDRAVREETRRNIVDRILAYRDNRTDVPWTRPDDPAWRQEPGIRYIGEIYAATWDVFGDSETDAHEIEGVTLDRLGNPAPGEPDGIVDDIEEKTQALRMLSQLLTTRSDVFTAHILIRGYAFDDENRTEPVVEHRVLAVLERANVFAEGGRAAPRLLGLHRY